MTQSQNPYPRSRGSNFTAGILIILMGSLVVAIAMGWIGTDPSRIHAPRWLLIVFGASFVLAGVWSIFQQATRAEGDTRLKGWVNYAFALLVLAALSVICLWAGFGSGEHLFVQDIGTGLDPETRPVDPTAGRIFFSAFGVLMSLVTVCFAASQPRKLLTRRPPEAPSDSMSQDR